MEELLDQDMAEGDVIEGEKGTEPEGVSGDLVRLDTVSLEHPIPDEGAFLPVPAGTAERAMANLQAVRMQEIADLVNWAADSGMYPGVPVEELFFKAMIGEALHIETALAFQHVLMIRNSPSLSAELQRSMLNRAGLRLVQLETDPDVCTLQLVSKKSGQLLGQASFSLEDASQAELLGSTAWQRWTSDMLFNRASTRVISRFCPWILIWSPEHPSFGGLD